MDIESRVKTLCDASPDLDSALVRDFVVRMDPEYFEHFPLQDNVTHLQLAKELTPEQPCAVKILKDKAGMYELAIVAYDYFSEFATLCGILSAFGLDIREAFIYTYTDQQSDTAPKKHPSRSPIPSTWRRPRPLRPVRLSRKKVVDVFRAGMMQGCSFGPKEQRHFVEELTTMLRLLDNRKFREVRNQVNRRLMETLGKLKTRPVELLHPVEIRFTNNQTSADTIMEIHSPDTPGFLYAFANALTMRGIYIAKATVENIGTAAHDRFYVRGRHGKKIEDQQEQQELIAAAALIKEFTHYLASAPDPAKALEHFDLLLDQLLKESENSSELSLLTQKPLLPHLARLFGTSDFLWEDFLRRQHANLLPVLEEYREHPLRRPKAELAQELRSLLAQARTPETRRQRLNEIKDRELFRIDMKHLLENTDHPAFSRALTDLAEVILDQVLQEAQATLEGRSSRSRPIPRQRGSFTICGMGKLGGRELGYASDIEVLFVYDGKDKGTKASPTITSEYGERLVQEILRWIEAKQEGIFHLDPRLRPHGEKGLLASSLEEIQQYYSSEGMAAPFERQALIKLRYVAGDESLGRLVEAHRDAFVYSGEPWPLETALHLRQRQIKELVEPGTINVKYSPGGLIDAEYAVQYLQIMHGRHSTSLRTSNTIEALAALEKTNVIPKSEAVALREDYLFLRRLIDALRIVRGNAKDLVLPPPDSDGMIFLARRLGLITGNWRAGAATLTKEITRHMARLHQFFKTRFGGGTDGS